MKEFSFKENMYKISFLFVLFLLLLLAFRLQIIDGEKNYVSSAFMSTNKKDIKPDRGIFYDTTGIPLVQNVPSFTVSIKKLDLSESENDNLKNFYNPKSLFPIESQNYYIFTNLSLELASKFLEFIDKKAITITPKTLRNYLYPFEFAHVLGFTGPITETDIEMGYSLDESIGKYKLEFSLENYLKGEKGYKRFFSNSIIEESVKSGDNVFLTINLDWQRNLFGIIASESEKYQVAGSAGVVLDASDGSIVAYVSYPGFDTNSFVKGVTQSYYENLVSDRRSPLIDKVISLKGPPGSVFKLITSYALLENNLISQDETFFSNRCLTLGRDLEFCEYGKFFYGNMDIRRAIYKSSNLFFCSKTLKSSNAMESVSKSATMFGLGEKTGIDLPGEISGNVDSVEYRKINMGIEWFDGDTCNAVIGQGANDTTVLQLAQMVMGIQNQGIIYQPHLIKEIKSPEGRVLFKAEKKISKTIPISPSTREVILDGMSQVAKNPEGTVYFFLKDLPGNLKVKTGTAETFENVEGQKVYRTHGWIVGIFEHQGKPYVFSFHMRFGGGGFFIADSVRQFINCLFYGCGN